MSKPVQTLTAAALAFALLAPATWAGENDHAAHQKAQSGASQKMDHCQMQNMDHGKMDHGAMHPAQDAKPKAESKDDR